MNVSEDPVREVARQLALGWATYEIKTYTAEGQRLINALCDALAKPAPPSLTQDECRAVSVILEQWDKSLPASQGFLDALESAREKLP